MRTRAEVRRLCIARCGAKWACHDDTIVMHWVHDLHQNDGAIDTDCGWRIKLGPGSVLEAALIGLGSVNDHMSSWTRQRARRTCCSTRGGLAEVDAQVDGQAAGRLRHGGTTRSRMWSRLHPTRQARSRAAWTTARPEARSATAMGAVNDSRAIDLRAHRTPGLRYDPDPQDLGVSLIATLARFSPSRAIYLIELDLLCNGSNRGQIWKNGQLVGGRPIAAGPRRVFNPFPQRMLTS